MLEPSSVTAQGKPASPTCPVCSTGLEPTFVKKGKHFWRCPECRLEMQSPLPTTEELAAYYDASYGSGLYRTFVEANAMKVKTADERFGIVSRHLPSGRWLDVGCSTGFFVASARKRGIDCEGIDVSTVAVTEGLNQGLPLSVSTLEAWYPPKPYDALTCFDVLEHVLDPVGFLGRARELLRPGGSIAITVPNLSSFSRRVMGSRWYYYIPEEHLHYFHPATLRRLVTSRGFVVQRCFRAYKPMTFEYSLSQFQEYNPLIYKVLTRIGRAVPPRAASAVWRLPIGEMTLVAQRPE